MESLLDAAQELCMRSGTHHHHPPRPDFAIPPEYHTIATNDFLEIRDCCSGDDDTTNKGKGYFAKCDLQRGTLIMVAKPIAMIMDWQGEEEEQEQEQDDSDHMQEEEDEEEQGEQEPRHNELLLLQVLERLQNNKNDGEPHLWNDCLTHLFPRNDHDLANLPAWVCHADEVFVQIETALQALSSSLSFTDEQVKDISRRLPLIVRYNVLSIETCPELLSHSASESPDHGAAGFSSLSGVGLYYLPSFFNHSSKHVNCCRFAIGDVMFFVTNQDVGMGQEVTISYLEHDVLCEGPARRNHMLSMNFNDASGHELLLLQQQEEEKKSAKAAAQLQHHGKGKKSSLTTTPSGGGSSSSDHDKQEDDDDIDDDHGPDLPVVDSDVQNELMSMDPFERLDAIEALLAQAIGARRPSAASAAASESTAATAAAAADDATMTDNHHHHHHHEAVASNSFASSSQPAWFQCDVQNLRILKAITLESMGQALQALVLWEEAVHFAETKLPPLDESSIVMRVQAALCAWQAQSTIDASGGNDVNENTTLEQEMQHRARHHANVALATHKLLFGGGVQRFKRRLGPDLRLNIRPVSAAAAEGGPCPVDVLWPDEHETNTY